MTMPAAPGATADAADRAQGGAGGANIPTGDLYVSLGLAQMAVQFGQSDVVREQAMREVEEIRAELRRRGEE